MSSPIAKSVYTATSKGLIDLHQKLSHKRRVSILAKLVASKLPPNVSGLCLDIGCGGMEITNAIQYQMPSLHVVGLDLYPAERAEKMGLAWKNYRQFDGMTLPYSDASAECAIFSDVLHHIPREAVKAILIDAGRVAKKIIIKDHFEYGWASRQMLRAMDFVGNWAYGVSVPNRYFTQQEFIQIAQESGLTIESLDVGVDLYEHLPVVRSVLRPEWQFVSVLASSK